jgi:alpha-L-fucosidase 2
VWIGAAAWLAQHLWRHYEYGRDREFLRERAYPFLREVARFYESYPIRDERGTYQVVPSQSPENRFTASGTRFPVSLCVSAAMDIQLAWDALTHAVRSAEIPGVDEECRKRWREILQHLPSLSIRSHGELLEWNREMEEAEPGHRRLLHPFALLPGEQISAERAPVSWSGARRVRVGMRASFRSRRRGRSSSRCSASVPCTRSRRARDRSRGPTPGLRRWT